MVIHLKNIFRNAGRLAALLLVSAFVLSGCNLREREKALEAKAVQLQQKEQQLLLKEQTLALQEEALDARQKQLDSAAIQADTLMQLYPQLIGFWSVKMVCTETTCPGSAIGDTRTEQWEVLIHNNTVIAKAINNNQVTRIYSGNFVNSERLEMVAQNLDTTQVSDTRIVIRLKVTDGTQIKGEREIIRPEDCHIVFDLELNKTKPAS